MTKYLIVMLMICGGCVLLDGTPTATPDSPTPDPTPDITPTQEIIDEEPLNDNFSFDVDAKFGHVTQIDNRDVFVPFSWLVRWIPNPAIHDPNPHPEVLARDGAVRFEVSNRGGAFGLAAHLNICAGCRYIVVAESVADIKPIFGAFLKSTDYFGYCRVDNLAGTSIITKPWRAYMQGEQEFICVFETSEARTVRFDALLNINWQVIEGHIDFTEVRALQVAPDSFGDSVVYVP